MSNEIDQKEKLLKLVRDAVEHDKNLREEFQVGEKFRFIRDRLQALLVRVEESVHSLQKKEETHVDVLNENEVLIYVYLYNTHGLVLQTWQKMLNPAVFYEYSVNRPIYPDQTSIDSFIRTKSNNAQHGYLTVIINKSDILLTAENKDAIGNSIIKVKEGSLSPNKLVSFTHNNHEYVLNEDGELIKKKK